MSIQLKKKSKLYRILELPDLSDSLIFGYLIKDIQNLICLDKTIAQAVLGRIRNHINFIYKSVQVVHKQNLPISKNGFTKIQPMLSKTTKSELKLEVPVYLSVNLLKKQTCFNLSYSYMIERTKKKNQKYLWTSQFQILPDGANRILWVCKQQNCQKQLPVYTSQILPVLKEDVICLMIPIAIAGKLIKQLKFYPIQIETDFNGTKKQLLMTTQSSFKGLMKPKNQCQIERMFEWIPFLYGKSQIEQLVEQILQEYTSTIKHEINPQGLMNLTSFKKSTVDNQFRLEFICKRQGTIKSIQHINQICIHGIKDKLLVKLKKKGTYIQSNKADTLKLRVGDTLILYIVKI